MAVSLQRWARPLTRVASPRYSTAEQARLRILFAAGIERLNFSFFVEVLHGLVHAAFAVFLFGLFTYLLNNVSLATALVSYAWIAIFSLVYTWFTFLPIFQPGYPGYTPLSNILARIIVVALACISRLSYLVPSLIRVSNANRGAARLRRGNLGLMKLAQDKAQKVQPKLDGDILKRTLDILSSDDDLEQFFEAIPGFWASKPVEDSRRSLDKLGPERLEGVLVLFWNRTLSSNRVSESVKGRRMLVCMKVIEVAGLSTAVPEILQHFSGNLGGVSRSVEICHSPGVPPNDDTASLARGIIASIIAINDKRDERWSMFAKDDLGISEDVLRRYLDHGDSVLLADLIHITRQFFHGLRRNSDLAQKPLNILSSLTKFNILDTLPELQHNFCALWNEIVQQTKTSADNIPFMDILNKIRGLYVDLHGTDAVFPSACTVSSHTTHMLEAGGTTTSGASHHIAITPPIPPSESSPGEVPAIGVVSDVVVITLPSSMSEPIAPSPSGTGDSDAPRPDGGTTVSPTVFDSVASDLIVFVRDWNHPRPQQVPSYLQIQLPARIFRQEPHIIQERRFLQLQSRIV
jgi:Family of unknown function (DUF6535)